MNDKLVSSTAIQMSFVDRKRRDEGLKQAIYIYARI